MATDITTRRPCPQSIDPPDGRRHGELGQAQSGYIDAVANHDAVAFRVADRVRPGLGEAIMARMLGPSIPVNPVTGGPGLRPYTFVITNAGGLDDMEYPDTSWLWQFGTWVNGGGWATCEARMMLAYAITGRLDFALDSYRVLLGFATLFRMDSPLVDFGSVPYQPKEPTNTVYDMWGIPAALLRGLWDPQYSAASLMLTPHVPGNLTVLQQRFPMLWGDVRVWVSYAADAPSSLHRPLVSVTLNGTPLPRDLWTASTVTLPWALLPNTGGDVTLNIIASSAESGAETFMPQFTSSPPPSFNLRIPMPMHELSAAASRRVLRAALPTAPLLLWLDAEALVNLTDGSPVTVWPDASPSHINMTQSATGQEPHYYATGLNGRPTVAFTRATQTFLEGVLQPPLPSEMTISAVFRDGGEAGEDCCSGIFYSAGGCNGIGTKAADVGTTIMIDWSGSDDVGLDDVTGECACII